MAAKTMASVVSGDELPRLAPDLSSFSDRNIQTYQQISNVDTTGSLTEVLALTGKFELGWMYLSAMTAGNIDKIKLTIDGVVIWNETGMSGGSTTASVIGQNLTNQMWLAYRVEESLSFEIQMTSDTTITLAWYARPIL